MRTFFCERIVAEAARNPKLVVVSGDWGFRRFGALELNPKQYVNCGTAEQSMVGVAAGLAIQGFLPVVATHTPFLVERAFEQVKLDVCQQRLKVILMGYSDYPNAGPTHQDDVSRAVMPAFQERTHALMVFTPTTKAELDAAVDAALFQNMPSLFMLKKYKP